MNKKRWIALIIFVALVGVSVLLQFPSVDEIGFFHGEDWVETVIESGSEELITVLDVEGMITASLPSGYFYDQYYHHAFFLNQLRSVYENPEVKAVVLRINSSGGGVSESDEIFQLIMDLRAEHPKPLVVFFDQVAASGGYYIAAPADHIVATRNTLTGSIGVIMQSINFHQLAENFGVEDVTFKSGPYKDLMNPLREMDEEEQAILQSIVDESYGFFVDAIVDGRGMDRSQVLALADGRVYTGPQALEKGLVDSLGRFEDSLEVAKELAAVENPTIIRIQRDDSFSWWQLLARGPEKSLLSRLIPGLAEIQGSRPVSVNSHPVPMYLWSW